MKKFALAFVAVMAWTSVCSAIEAGPFPEHNLLIRADWQAPLQLPPRFRNHCHLDKFSGRPYCANHCGLGYQFYYCSRASFGCCLIGRGYCGEDGALRCHP